MFPSFIFILPDINCSLYFVVLSPLIRVSVIEFNEQYKWFGLFSTVHSCLFLMCASYVCFCYYISNIARYSLDLKKSLTDSATNLSEFGY